MPPAANTAATYSVRENVVTGERAPNASPAITVSATPSRSSFGSVAAAWCSNDGSHASCSRGSATQVWMPCTVCPRARASSGVRSEWTIPRPAVIQLTSPGTIFCTEPRLSRCRIAPSNR